MARPWENQEKKKAENIRITIEDMKNFIGNVKDSQHKFLLALTYLTAGRISEVLAIRKQDITLTDRQGISIMLILMPNRKNKKFREKLIPIRLDLEGWLAGIVMEYISGREGSLFTFRTTRRARQIFALYGFNPHYFRHLRATHLTIYRSYKLHQLMQFGGWSSTEMPIRYTHLNWEDLL